MRSAGAYIFCQTSLGRNADVWPTTSYVQRLKPQTDSLHMRELLMISLLSREYRHHLNARVRPCDLTIITSLPYSFQDTHFQRRYLKAQRNSLRSCYVVLLNCNKCPPLIISHSRNSHPALKYPCQNFSSLAICTTSYRYYYLWHCVT